MLILTHVVDAPKADGAVCAWIKRHSGNEYLMMATVLGVVIATVSVIVGPLLLNLGKIESHVTLSNRSWNVAGNA